MPTILLITLVLSVFSGIVITDFKYRFVYRWQVPLFYVACILLGQYSDRGPTLQGIIFNFIYLGIQVCIGYAWLVSQQRERGEKIIDQKIGLGDLLLVPALAFGFDTPEFVLTYTFSLIFSLALALVLKSRAAKDAVPLTIPLAGCVALFYCIWLPLRSYLPLSVDFF
jgi:hypothetical protein